MDPNIHVQILCGPDAGLQKALTDPRIGFGRAPENAICVEEPNASRQHGELVFHEGHWYVLNRSPNGTTVNGRRIKGDQPIALKPGDVVGVAKTKLLSVHFTPPAAPVKAAEPAGPKLKRKKLSGRAQFWTGWAIVMGALAVLWAVMPEPTKNARKLVPSLTPQQIEKEILKPLTVPIKDDREAASQLAEAQQLFSRRTIKASSLFETYNHYKLSLAHSGKRSFEGLDQIQFAQVEAELIDRTTRNYTDAYNKVASAQWVAAEKALRDLREQYPVEESLIYKNVSAQLDFVLAVAPKRKSF